MTACAAVWCGTWIASREVENLNMQLMQTARLSRELVIKDRSRLAAIRQDEWNFDEQVWQVFVPREGMKIHVATAGVNTQLYPYKLPKSEASAELQPGLHNLELKIDQTDIGWRVLVEMDMETLLDLPKESSWNPRRGSTGGSTVDTQFEFKEGGTAVLFQRVFVVEDGSGQRRSHPKGNGVVMWIE